MISARLPVTALLLLITVLINCCTNTSKEKNISQMEKEYGKSKTAIPDSNKPEPLAPGTADIKAWMQEFTETEDQYICKLKVEEVNGYGPAAPPLPPGYLLNALVPMELIKKNNYLADKIFVKGKLLEMSVRAQGRMPGSGEALPWVVTKIQNLR
ncbi:MAG: hypothetical protein ACM3Q2_10300 [Syntrophothermus sp.]